MFRKIVFVLVALALPFVAASAASAQQYPPSGDGTTIPADPATERPAAGGGAPARGPLARTGANVTLLVGVAVVLLAGGAVALVATRRRPGGLTA